MKRLVILAAVALLLLAGTALADEKKNFEPEDYHKMPGVGGPAVSADGNWVAYSMKKFNAETDKTESDIYIRPLSGGDAIQLTSAAGSESGYTWHPEKNLLAFSAKREGKKSQIYVINIAGGEAKKITNAENGASSPQWSPDGSMIAFYSKTGEQYKPEFADAYGDVIYAKNLRYYHLGPGWDRGKRQRIFVVPATGGVAKQLTDGPCADEGDRSMAWSPDSRTIAFVSNREKEWWNTIDTNIYLVDVETANVSKFSDNIGPDHSPSFSPDGKSLAWRGSFRYNYESENYKVLVAPVTGGEHTVYCKDHDRNINNFQWSADSSRIYFSSSDRGYRHIKYFDLATPENIQQLTSGDWVFRSWKVLADGSAVMTAGNSTFAGDVHHFVDGKMKPLTTCIADHYSQYNISPCEEIWIKTKDGANVQGWLVKPIGYEEGTKYPMILSIHGGPHGMSTPSLRFEFQLYAQQGIAVLFTNPRGSDGYGQAFADIIKEDWHTHPEIDLLSFVDHVVEQGIADPEKLGVMGGSYGGFMTNWLIGATDTFATAVSVAGLSNMVSFYGSTDEQFFAEHEMAGAPWMNKEKYLENSPLWYAPNFTTPTMVVHGANDWRVRPEQGRQLFTALQKMGVPSVYVEFPDEQHGVRGKDHMILYYKLKKDWFGHWLQGKDVGLAEYITPEKYELKPESIKQESH